MSTSQPANAQFTAGDFNEAERHRMDVLKETMYNLDLDSVDGDPEGPAGQAFARFMV